MGLDFIAVDVETANAQRGSICAFGLAVVQDGEVVRSENFLCKPPVGLDWFDSFNVSLHGVTAAMVNAAPPFDERLAQVLDVVGDLPVVAHNAAFDIGAIRQGCDAASTEWPELTYGCTMVLSRRILTLLSYRLPVVCASLGIPLLGHHHASTDAGAAALIALELARRQRVDSLAELASSVSVRMGRVRSADWLGCVRVSSSNGSSGSERPPHASVDADPHHPLYGQVMVFTGGLSLRREDAWEAVAAVGATPEKDVTRRTTMLVVGDGFAGDSVEEFHTGKAVKAARWLAKGHTIEVLSEDDFLELLAMESAGTRGC